MSFLRRNSPQQVAGEEVGGGDGHDGRGDERADCDGGEAEAGEPLGEHLEEEQRDGEVGGLWSTTPAASATKPSSAMSPSRKVYAGSNAALRRMTFAVFRAEDCGRRVWIEHQRDGAADREGRVRKKL